MRLGTRLMLSHVVLVMLCLALLGGASVVVITRAQRQVNLQRALDRALAMAESLRALPNGGANAPDLMARLRRDGNRLNGRILLLDQAGLVLADLQGEYTGQRVPIVGNRTRLVSAARRHTFADGQEYFVIIARLTQPQQERLNAALLAVAVHVADIDPPWRAMLPILSAAVAGVLVLALGLAFVLSRSVTRPVSAMTKAAQQIALGDYEQRIDVPGRDEIAELAQAFNSMSSQVAQAQQTQRDFLANVSHDLRTPLTSIQGFSQAILEDAITDTQGYKRAATIIQQESTRMHQLVEDLLELARLESGELAYDAQPLSLLDMLAHEVGRHQAQAEKRNLDLELNIPPEVPTIWADSHRLTQVWANLLNNAIQYATPNSTIEIVGEALSVLQTEKETPWPVRFGEQRHAGRWVRVTCSNQTNAVDSQQLGRIFDRFYRSDRARSHPEGTGLGLSIVRETVLAHGGMLEARHTAPDRLSFRVWLPVSPSPKKPR